MRIDGPPAPCDCPTACGGRWYTVPKGERVLKVLKFDGAFGPESCGGGFAADYKKGRGSGFGHTFGVRVDGPPARGLWPPNGGRLCSLRSGGNGPSGRGLWIALWAMSFIMPPSAVTSTSSIIIKITPVHPFATLWPSSPKGDARSVTGLASGVICDTISSVTYFLVFP